MDDSKTLGLAGRLQLINARLVTSVGTMEKSAQVGFERCKTNHRHILLF